MIIWNCTSSVEVKKIPVSDLSVVNFVVATNSEYKNREGVVMKEVEYHRCVAYGSLADLLGQYLTKGKKIYLEGKLKTKKRQDSTGQDKRSTEIIASNVIFLSSRPAGENWSDMWSVPEEYDHSIENAPHDLTLWDPMPSTPF